MIKPLEMWTVYDHPTDFPDCFVARLWLIDADGPKPSTFALKSESIDELRSALVDQGLTVLDRMPGDDAKILEVWL